MSYGDIFEALRQLGPRYAPPFIVLLVCAFVVWYRWKLGFRQIGDFVGDSLLWVTVAIGASVLATYYCLYGLPTSFGSGQIGILIAPIPGDEHREEQNSYLNAIRSLVLNDSTLRDVVKVRLLRRELSEDPDRQHEQAISLGRRLRASFIIRAVPEVGGHRLWLSVVDLPEFATKETALGKVSSQQLAQLDKLPLPTNVILLARCALAFSYKQRRLHEQTAAQLVQILAAPEFLREGQTRAYFSFSLAESYWSQRLVDPAHFLPMSIEAFDNALQEWTHEDQPIQWAETMNNRGAAYAELPGPDLITNLEEAIRSFDLALEVRTRVAYPVDWALTMNNRGVAYMHLPGPDRVGNLREAIRSFDLALEVRTRARYPTDWAMTMNNRGAAYADLRAPDHVANLREAIRSSNLAMEIYNREDYPADWALCMNNRGRAYAELPGPDRAANLQDAIRSFELALEVRTRERYPTDWAMTMINLGAAHGQLPEPDRAGTLRISIRFFNLALEVYTRERYPTDWASIMLNLGNAYAELPEPNRAANLREAIRSYDFALEEYTRENFPNDWATIMYNRGTAFQDLPGPDRANNLREAIRCFQAALVFFEAQGSTRYIHMARRNLYQARRQLNELEGSS